MTAVLLAAAGLSICVGALLCMSRALGVRRDTTGEPHILRRQP